MMDDSELKPHFKNLQEREHYLIDEFEGCITRPVIDRLIVKGFCSAPASTKYHGAYEGGLFDHSVAVANVLKKLTENNQLDWSKTNSARKIGLLHDLCKIDQYKPDGNGGFTWNNDALVKGHGIKSVTYAWEFGETLTPEESACILYHMGAFCEKDEWRDYTNAIKSYPNVLWTHTADMIASQIMEV